jgi:hypothetical protein
MSSSMPTTSAFKAFPSGSSKSHDGKEEVPDSPELYVGGGIVPVAPSVSTGNEARPIPVALSLLTRTEVDPKNAVIDTVDGPVHVNLDIADYCPWMDENLTLEARVTAFEHWQQLTLRARTAYKAEGKEALRCTECKKKHPQPHIESSRLRETNKAAICLMRQWKEQKRPSKRKDTSGPASDKIAPSPVEKKTDKPESSEDARKARMSRPKGKSAPTCPSCGRSHWPQKSGPGCKSPTCPKCQYNHWPQETCLDAQNRMRAAGLVVARPQPVEPTAAQLDVASSLGSLFAHGAFDQVPVALAQQIMSQAIQPAQDTAAQPSAIQVLASMVAAGIFKQVPGAEAKRFIEQKLQLAPATTSSPVGSSTTPTHPSRKRKQKTPDTSEADSEKEREKKRNNRKKQKKYKAMEM